MVEYLDSGYYLEFKELVGGTLTWVDRSNLLQADTLQYNDEINARSTLSLTLVNVGEEYRPAEGQEMRLSQFYTAHGVRPSEVRFAGTVSTSTRIIEPGSNIVSIEVECVDYAELLDRHVVYGVWLNSSPKKIIQDLLDLFYPNEGIGLYYRGEDPDPIIPKIVFDYCTMTEALDKLVERTGYSYYVDTSKWLRFFARSTNIWPYQYSSPFDETWFKRLSVQRSRDDYRNRQWVRGGNDVSSERHESFFAENSSSWDVSMPIAKEPKIFLNGVEQFDIGVGNLNDEDDESCPWWLWNYNSATVKRSKLSDELDEMDLIDVYFQGLFPIITVEEDPAEITERILVEGGSGVYERCDEYSDVDGFDLITETAQALLRRYGKILGSISFETDCYGFKPGFIFHVDRIAEKYKISGDYLIVSVNASDGGGYLTYTVEAVSGEAVGGWVEFWKRLLRRIRPAESESGSIIIGPRFRDFCKATENMSWVDLPPCCVVASTDDDPFSRVEFVETLSDAAFGSAGEGIAATDHSLTVIERPSDEEAVVATDASTQNATAPETRADYAVLDFSELSK